jgi:hypothetical protein
MHLFQRLEKWRCVDWAFLYMESKAAQPCLWTRTIWHVSITSYITLSTAVSNCLLLHKYFTSISLASLNSLQINTKFIFFGVHCCQTTFLFPCLLNWILACASCRPSHLVEYWSSCCWFLNILSKEWATLNQLTGSTGSKSHYSV